MFSCLVVLNPGSEAVKVYLPGGKFKKTKAPRAEVWVALFPPIKAELAISTVAPGSGAPSSSTTVPVTLPYSIVWDLN